MDHAGVDRSGSGSGLAISQHPYEIRTRHKPGQASLSALGQATLSRKPQVQPEVYNCAFAVFARRLIV